MKNRELDENKSKNMSKMLAILGTHVHIYERNKKKKIKKICGTVLISLKDAEW